MKFDREGRRERPRFQNLSHLSEELARYAAQMVATDPGELSHKIIRMIDMSSGWS